MNWNVCMFRNVTKFLWKRYLISQTTIYLRKYTLIWVGYTVSLRAYAEMRFLGKLDEITWYNACMQTLYSVACAIILARKYIDIAG